MGNTHPAQNKSNDELSTLEILDLASKELTSLDSIDFSLLRSLKTLDLR